MSISIDEVPEYFEHLKDRIALLERHEKLALITFHEVEQTLGKALGYPWFKDDPKNFPDATEADGVCVGEHVPQSIALVAANKIKELEAELATLETKQSAVRGQLYLQVDDLKADSAMLRSRLRQARELIDEVASQCPEENDWLDVARRWLAAEIGGE